jgi:hypothetical protein
MKITTHLTFPRLFWLLAGGFWLLTATGCFGPKPPASKPAGDIELSQELSSARAAFSRGAWAQAATLYGLALKRAEAMDDPNAIADIAYNYAAALTQGGRYADARQALLESKTEAARAKSPSLDILTLEARVARLQADLDAASSLADAVLTEKSATPEQRLQAYLVKGQIAAAHKEAAAAAESLRQARSNIGAGTSPAFAAGIEELAGEVALLEQKPAAAAERFDRQAEFLRRARLYGDMYRALGRAGAAYADAGNTQLAADRYYRAARSALAQNEGAGAQLLDAADRVGDAGMHERIARLRKSFPTTRP